MAQRSTGATINEYKAAKASKLPMPDHGRQLLESLNDVERSANEPGPIT